ncbi:putative ABC multidrug transporter [Thozetella sp. PMI_491]|nr:putative ABC multidrug transporter [Thozetella sp. PMI_491]
MLFSTCANDDSLGPNVVGCRDDFDFTVKFEQLVFSFAPSTLFIVLSIWRTRVLLKRRAIVNAPGVQLVKLGTIATYIGLQLALVLLVGIRSLTVTSLAIAATVLQLVAALSMATLSVQEHTRSPRPSILLSSYLFITTLLDAAQTRTIWLAAGTKPEITYATVFTAAVGVKVIMTFLEAQRKTKWIAWNAQEHSPEETSGIYSLGIYFWLNKLFFDGYKSILRPQDLYPLDVGMAGSLLQEKFEKKVDYSEFATDKHALLKTLGRTLPMPLLLPILPRLALLAFRFCQPFFISSLIDYLSLPEAEASVNAAYGFIGASILIYCGIAVSTALYWYFQYRSMYLVRGCLVSAIYRAATEAEIGSGDSNAALTLMSTDIERIRVGFLDLHDIWGSLIETAIASWLLYEQLAAAFAAPIVLVLCCIIAMSVLVRYTGDSQRKWMEGVQKRVGLTGSVIANMKNLKLSGLADPIFNALQKLRIDELGSGNRFRILLILAALVAFVPIMFSPVVTFGVAQRTLDARQLFTSLSYLMLLSTPLMSLFQSFPRIVAAMACLDRIQAFLAGKTRQDFRTRPSAPGSDPEKQTLHKPFLPGIKEQLSAAISVRNGTFGWTADKMVLKNIDIDVPHSALTIVVGPIASGKSTLMKALLGEIPVRKGSIALSKHFQRVGFCDQVAFLFNGSIRENITGFSPFDPGRYREVIDAAMLTDDLEALPLGDRSNVGSNGITLSGGQRQRVSLARALYLQSDLLIFDDVFSGLDADTEEQIFHKAFGPQGLIRRRGATAVLCTHSVHHLPAADHIIALGLDGTVVEQGRFETLVTNKKYIHSLNVKAASGDASPERTTSKSDADEVKLLKTNTNASNISEVDNARQAGDRTVYLTYFRSMGWSLAIGAVISAAAMGFLSNYSTVWLKYWADDAAGDIPAHSFGYWIGVYAALQAASLGSLLALGVVCFIVSARRSGAWLHSRALKTLIRAPLKFFTDTDQGVIINMFSQDLNLVDTELPNGFLNTLYSLSSSIGAAAVLITSSPYLAISYPFLIASLWLIQKFYLRTSRQMRLLDLEAKSPLYTHYLDTTKGILGFVLAMMVTIIAAILTSLAVRLRSNSGFTGASLVLLMNFGESLMGIVLHYTQLETSIGAIARLNAFNKNVKPEDRENELVSPPEEWPQRGEIELNGVSATYNSDASEDPLLNAALCDIKLKISARENVAICGRTGSGKSSVLALILKLLDPLQESSENVQIDGIVLARIDRRTLRSRLLAVPQDAVFLPDGSTFQDNLDPFDAATATECQAVFETVGLWSFVQERGGLQAGMIPSTLSQGQRQLFSLARVVLRGRLRARHTAGSGGTPGGGILLLDEVSSSVDYETERAMRDIIKTEFQHYTVLAVSHRLDMIMDFDRVVVLDRGKVVEVGKPRELASDENTRFGELYRAGGH